MALTPRQQLILNVVSDLYIRQGTPVSSQAVVALAELRVSPSTVRNELSILEEQGYLTHPHTSAGRVPTSLGYREFVDWLLRARPAREAAAAPDHLAAEVDDALQQTSEAMSQATNLLALVVAPQASGARVRHVELLRLQPNLVMVMFILATGRVIKRIVDFPAPVDPGMVEWARSYLNESIGGRILSERLVRSVLTSPELSSRERAFLHALDPAFDKLVNQPATESLYVGGASRLLSEAHFEDLTELRDLLHLLEERYVLLRMLRLALHFHRQDRRQHRVRARRAGAAALLAGGGELRPAPAESGDGQPAGSRSAWTTRTPSPRSAARRRCSRPFVEDRYE